MTYVLEIIGRDNSVTVLANVHEVEFRDHEHKCGVGIARVRIFGGVERQRGNYNRETGYTMSVERELMKSKDYEIPVQAIMRSNNGEILSRWTPTTRQNAKIDAVVESLTRKKGGRVEVDRVWLERIYSAFDKISKGRLAEVKVAEWKRGIKVALDK